jgi:hypothetical protein
MGSRVLQPLRYAFMAAVLVFVVYGTGSLLRPGVLPSPFEMPPLSTGQSVLAPFFGGSSAPHERVVAESQAEPAAQPRSPKPAPAKSTPQRVRPAKKAAQRSLTPRATRPEPVTGAEEQQRFVAVADPACDGCKVSQNAAGTILATIDGNGSGADTAYALLDFGGDTGPDGPVSVQDRIGLGSGQTPPFDLQVLQVLDSSKRVVYRLVISAGDRVLRLQSPPGALSATPIDLSTGIQVPNDGRSALLVGVRSGAGAPLVVSVDGKQVSRVERLQGGTAGRQRFLAAGVVASTAGAAGAVPVARASLSVTHANVSVAVARTPSSGAGPLCRPRSRRRRR